MEKATSDSSSKLPAILMILPNDHHLIQKQQYILLTQMTFETFPNLSTNSKNANRTK